MSYLGTRAFVGAAFAVGLAAPAMAADFYEPPIVEAPPPLVTKSYGGWYIRGHIGMSNQTVDDLDNLLFADPGVLNLQLRDKNFEAGILAGAGVGYRLNKWLRGDLTVEYRGEAGFHGLDTWNDGVNARFNNYTAKKSEWLLLANAYVDLGKWHGISPYLGAGIGASRNTIHSFRDAGIDPFGNPTLAYASSASKWNLAWALHAGMSFDVTDNLALDLGYSFVSLGDAQSGDIIAYDGTNNVNNPMHFKDIYSHDIKLGLRYQFGGAEHVAYDPAPVYEPEPLVYK